MTEIKTNGRETAQSTFDNSTEEKLNSLDNLMRLRSKITADNQQKVDKEPNDPEEELGGLPGFEGIF